MNLMLKLILTSLPAAAHGLTSSVLCCCVTEIYDKIAAQPR